MTLSASVEEARRFALALLAGTERLEMGELEFGRVKDLGVVIHPKKNG